MSRLKDLETRLETAQRAAESSKEESRALKSKIADLEAEVRISQSQFEHADFSVSNISVEVQALQ